MDDFIKFMDRIKAEEELKKNTKDFIKTTLERENQNKMNEQISKASKLNMRKLFIAASSVAACAMLAVGGLFFYNTPVNYLSLDINPSVELGLNAFNTVVSCEAYNEDGALLLKDNKLSNLSIEEAVVVLVGEASEQGFIADDGSTVIVITAESDNEELAAKLQSKGEEGLKLALETKNMAAIVYSDCSGLELRTRARQMGISPGKYKLIAVLQALDPSIMLEQFRYAKITEIITKAGELMALNPSSADNLGGLGKNIEMIIEAANEVQAAKGNTNGELNLNNEQEQNQNQGSTGMELEQNQNKEQESSVSQPSQGQGPLATQQQNQGASTGTQYSENSVLTQQKR